ncbi:activator-dependent family glycosyltransferase [Streptomyces sp. NBC_01387]|uniref:activator-dependent family glycosyltransferase n=1 Tax=Streptomyces sp. NBC_01387 TaxID=2903849 RepID=UPI003252256E
MRVLFATIPEKSHLFCLTPLAWAARAAGHEVRVASTAEFVDVIARTGMTAVAVGSNDGISAAMSANRETQQWDSVNWSELDPPNPTYQEEFDRAQLGAYGCAMYNEPMIDDLVAFARDWRPDLVVWDPLTYAGPIAAGVAGAAHVRSLCFADVWVKKRQLFLKLAAEAPSDERARDPLGGWLTERTEQFGGTYSPESTTGQLTLDPLPDSLAIDTGVARAPVRFVPYNGPAVVPAWLRTPPERPRICLSLGASNTERYGGDYVSKSDILESLAELDAEVVAALLPSQVRELGALPANVRVVESVPLHALLPSCSVLIHHGGFGSYANALVHGVPQLTVTTPVADQIYRGAGLERQGAGLLLESASATAGQVRERTARILSDAAFQENSDRLREEALARPAPADVIPVLEKLVAERRTDPWTV